VGKKFVPLLLAVAMTAVFMTPGQGQAASEIDKINRELKNLKQQMQELESSKDETEQKAAQIASKRNKTMEDIRRLLDEIDQIGATMNKTNEEIEQTEADLQATAAELQEAIERVEARDQLLRSRVRLMYTNGFVSYLDVLLSATSFTDFLDRFDALKSIISQDREILEENKRDKQLVEEKKAQVEQKLADVKSLYAKLEAEKSNLVAKENEKRVMVLSYEAEMEQLEEISEEQSQMLMTLAAKVSKLEKEKVEAQRREAARREAAKRAAAKKSGGTYTGGKLLRPISTDHGITSSFGTRVDPITGKRGSNHTGVDFGAPSGTDIVAADDGVVIVAQWWSGYGNCVIIDHGDGLWTLYGHIRHGGIKVKVGEEVKRGEKIAEVGTTGRSTGPHLHFEVIVNQKKVNPLDYLK
jgi:murein DD-endopeptidase MepM/ murein hydrolase activator NlpD